MPDPGVLIRLLDVEGAFLPDELVAQLPRLPSSHPRYGHWRSQNYALERLVARMRILPLQLSILVIGCGNGWSSFYLSQLAKTTVVGVDIVSRQVEQAERVFGGRKNLEFQVADIFRDPISPGSFDQVVIHAAAEWYPEVGQLLGQALEFLNPKGEVHIVGSPFWELSGIPAARKSKAARLEAQGAKDLIGHCHFHSMEEMTALGAHLLYNPYNRSGGLKFRARSGRDSSYPWWMMPEQRL